MNKSNLLGVGIICLVLFIVFLSQFYHYGLLLDILTRVLGIIILVAVVRLTQKAVQGYGATWDLWSTYGPKKRLSKPKEAYLMEKIYLWLQIILTMALAFILLSGILPRHFTNL